MQIHSVAAKKHDAVQHSSTDETLVRSVGNGSNFCTRVLICSITFHVLRVRTFVFNKCSEKIFKIIFVVKIQRVLIGIMLAQRRSITSALDQCIVLAGVSGAGMFKRHQHNAAVRKHGTLAQCCFNDGPASNTVGQHWTSIG